MDVHRFDVLIVGGGHGGAQAAIALRQRGFKGKIAILGEEDVSPYERPALSKEYLRGDKGFERMLIRPDAFWAARDITLLRGRRVVSVDADAHRVATTDGTIFGYGRLVWAAGGEARRLRCPGADLAGIHRIRHRKDVDNVKTELVGARKVAVIGGGYIGLEAASALSDLGHAVTVLEAQDRVLARVAGLVMPRFLEAEHRAHGVDIRLGIAVRCIEGDGGRASGVRLANGECIETDLIIVGIGIEPAVDPLRRAGAACQNGVAVDRQCRTTLQDVWAIGDCAQHENPFAEGTPIRLESVQNANDMAVTAAKAIMGERDDYNAVPWFWSHQYDLNLQTVGLSSGHDLEILRGDPTTRSFSVVYLQAGRVIALDCLNAAKDYVQGRALVTGRARPAIADLRNPAIPLKSIVTALVV